MILKRAYLGEISTLFFVTYPLQLMWDLLDHFSICACHPYTEVRGHASFLSVTNGTRVGANEDVVPPIEWIVRSQKEERNISYNDVKSSP